MADPTAKPPGFRRQLWLARIVLALAAVLVAVAHGLPLDARWVDPEALPFGQKHSLLVDFWKAVPSWLKHVAHGDVTLSEADIPVFLLSMLVVPALPFLAGILSRVRAARWVMGLVTIGLSIAWLALTVPDLGVPVGIGWSLLWGGLWLSVLGLLLIPEARPLATLPGWRTMMALFTGYALVMGSQRWVRLEVTRLAPERFQTACRKDFVNLRCFLLDYYWQYGHPPPARQGWEVLMIRANGPSAGDHPKLPLTSIPIDPWGNPYRYTDRAVGTEHGADDIPTNRDVLLSSDGPDGIPGTADDLKAAFESRGMGNYSAVPMPGTGPRPPRF